MRLSARSTFFALATAASFSLAACGGGGDDDDGPIVIEGDPHTYVVDSVTIPEDQTSANMLGFDLDGDLEGGDAAVDNQLGSILSALISAAGSGSLDLQGSIDEAVNAGEILLLANMQATDLTNASNAGFEVFLGANPSPAACTDPADPTTCRQHLGGDGTFEIAAGGDQDARIGGNIIGGTFTGKNGEIALQIAFAETQINLNLTRAQAEVTGVSATGLASARIGGAVPDEQIQNEVIPAIAIAISDIVVEEGCMAGSADCGCPGGTAETLLGIFDDNSDCAITESEVREDDLIMTLLRPDVDTDEDGTKDALSVGVGASAVSGTFTVP